MYSILKERENLLRRFDYLINKNRKKYSNFRGKLTLNNSSKKYVFHRILDTISKDLSLTNTIEAVPTIDTYN